MADIVIREPVLAAVAAEAAVKVPGVLRLQPGLPGLVTGAMRAARERLTGRPLSATEGVHVDVDTAPDGTVTAARLTLDLVISAQDQAAAVAASVRRTVAASVTAATGIPVASVTVTILDIEPAGAP